MSAPTAVYLCELANEDDRAGFLLVPLDVPNRAHATLELAQEYAASGAREGLAWAEVTPGRWEAPHPRLATFRWLIVRVVVVGVVE